MAFEILGNYAVSGTWDLWYFRYANGYGYVRDYTQKYIRKIRISDMTQVAYYYDGANNEPWYIDPTNNYLYCYQFSGSNVYMKKFDISGESISLVATSSIYADEPYGYDDGCIDLVNNKAIYNFGFFGGSWEKLVKVDLTNLTFTTHSISPTHFHYCGGAFHNGYGYWATGLTGGNQEILKLDTSSMTVAGLLTIPDYGESEFLGGTKVDTIHNYLYALAYGQFNDETDTGGFLFKIDLSTFTLNGYVNIPAPSGIYTFAIDEINQIAYCADEGWYTTFKPTIYVVDCKTMTVLGTTLTLTEFCAPRRGTGIDVANGFLLVGSQGFNMPPLYPGRLWKIGLYSTSLPISSIYHKWHEPVVII